MQFNPFHGVNRDNVYIEATQPTSEPNDAILLPTDDATF